MKLVFDSILEYTIPDTRKASEILESVNKFLLSLYGRTLPDGFFEQESNTRPAKRVSKWLHDQHQIEIQGYALSQLGSLIEDKSEMTGSYYFDFTRDLIWKAGDFGDSGSCFMNSSVRYLLMLQESQTFAVRFYNKLEDGAFKGKARAWVYPLDDNRIAVWNAKGSYGSSTINTVLSKYFDLPIQPSQTYQVQIAPGGDRNTAMYFDSTPIVIGEKVEDLVLIIPQFESGKRCQCGRAIQIDVELCHKCREGQDQ